MYDPAGHVLAGPKTTDAGWSSQVAREAHNLEVAGSNPVPATFIRCSAFAATRNPGCDRGFSCALKDFYLFKKLHSPSTCGKQPILRFPTLFLNRWDVDRSAHVESLR